MFGGPEVSYHQTYSARDWLSILRTPYPTQNLQRKPSNQRPSVKGAYRYRKRACLEALRLLSEGRELIYTHN